ncbi:MAG: hypothetical protein K2P99_06780 [Burkholderiales bacterium]|nr:hypothetical protein [Burkholderiales bacterium]
MITVGQIFDNIFSLNKCVNGIIYNDDFKTDIKYKFYTSRYMMDQVFNYVFKNTFEQLDPEHGSPNIDITQKIINTEYEAQEICTQIITRITPIIQAMHCILRDCDPMYYGKDYMHDTIFKHEKSLGKYEGLVHTNIYKHHLVLREEDKNQKSNHLEKAGDYLIYLKQDQIIKFIMLAQHPASIMRTLKKMRPLISKNYEKVDTYYFNRINKFENTEKFKWTKADCLYLMQKMAVLNPQQKWNKKIEAKSIKMHKMLICLWAIHALENDPILTQN